MASRGRTVVGLVVAKIDLKMEPFFFSRVTKRQLHLEVLLVYWMLLAAGCTSYWNRREREHVCVCVCVRKGAGMDVRAKCIWQLLVVWKRKHRERAGLQELSMRMYCKTQRIWRTEGELCNGQTVEEMLSSTVLWTKQRGTWHMSRCCTASLARRDQCGADLAVETPDLAVASHSPFYIDHCLSRPPP